ncbi:hypothetical protein MMPV_003203 [Pyropia vietnamensis]
MGFSLAGLLGRRRAPPAKSHLLEFYGVECDHCVEMHPLMDQLQAETGLTLRGFEVWFNQSNLKLLSMLDKDGACGGVPFYFNKKTRGWICGATTYPNFHAWATGAPHERFLPPPKEEENTRLGAAQSFFARIRETAMERMSVREGGAGGGTSAAADGTKTTGTSGGGMGGASGAAPKMSVPEAGGSLEARAASSQGGGPLGVLRALGLGGKGRGGGILQAPGPAFVEPSPQSQRMGAYTRVLTRRFF